MTTVFYSWQSDSDKTTNRNLIERALKKAIEELEGDAEVESAVRDDLVLDKDTQGVPGTPPIVETIFSKIDAASAFVPDLTFVGSRPNGRPTSNPNVLIEYGWALKALGHSRMIPVMNTAYGAPSGATLPFDMAHLRHPITYFCPEDATEEDRQKARSELTKALKGALKSVMVSRRPSAKSRFAERTPAEGAARFRLSEEAVGEAYATTRGIGSWSDLPVYVEGGPSMWLRLIPKQAQRSTLSALDIQKAMCQPSRMCLPLNHHDASNVSLVRGPDGFGTCVDLKQGYVPAVSYIFETGELWTLDTSKMTEEYKKSLFFGEEDFVTALRDGIDVLQELGVTGPYRWMAGIEGIKGKEFLPIGYSLRRSNPSFVADEVSASGEVHSSKDAKSALEPFFKAVFDKAHMPRPRQA